MFMLKNYRMIVLGVYRLYISSKDKNGKIDSEIDKEAGAFYYVVTSPPPDMELNEHDKLYVLCQNYPSEDYMKKALMDESKQFLNKMDKNNIFG